VHSRRLAELFVEAHTFLTNQDRNKIQAQFVLECTVESGTARLLLSSNLFATEKRLLLKFANIGNTERWKCL